MFLATERGRLEPFLHPGHLTSLSDPLADEMITAIVHVFVYPLRDFIDHRISQVGRDPQGTSGPAPGSAQDHPKPSPYVQDHCPNVLWTIQNPAA